MIRQSLDADSPYADACLHANGLTAIQWRDTKGDVTYETQAQANGPKRIRLEKRGDYLSMSFGSSDKDMQTRRRRMQGGFHRRCLHRPGRLPHNAARIETAMFSEVAINTLPAPASTRTQMISTLETIQVSSKDRRAVYLVTQPGIQRAEAPNWSADNMLYFNSHGKMYKIKADMPAHAADDSTGRSRPCRPRPAHQHQQRSRHFPRRQAPGRQRPIRRRSPLGRLGSPHRRRRPG